MSRLGEPTEPRGPAEESADRRRWLLPLSISDRNQYPARRGDAYVGHKNLLVARGDLRDLYIDLNQAGADQAGVGNGSAHAANGHGRKCLERVGRIDGAGFRGEHTVDVELHIVTGMDFGGAGFDGGIADDRSGGDGDCRGEGQPTSGICEEGGITSLELHFDGAAGLSI